MATSSQKSAAKPNLLGKRNLEDGFQTQPILKRHRDLSEEKQIEGRVELLETNSDEANLISLKVTVEGDLQIEPILKSHRDLSEEKETTKGFADDLRRVELLETKSDEANLISVKGIDKTPDFVDEAAETVNETPVSAQEHALVKKTVFVSRLPPEITISDIIDFFKDVGRVVRVRRQLSGEDQHLGSGFVEFASANEAKKALEKKKVLGVLHHRAQSFPPKYCIDHKVWYEEEDYLQQESLSIGEDETPPDFGDKEAAMKKKTLFLANLSPQTTKISHIIQFFRDVAQVVSVRLIVNHEGKHVGYGFVEFASAYKAKRALEIKNGEYLHDHKILLKGLDETPSFPEAVPTVRNKTLFIAQLAGRTKISDIINFFKDVGEVVHVRLFVDPNTKPVRFGFVEFASANEAEKALEKKNREYLHEKEILLDNVMPPPYPLQSKYCIDHKVGYEDYPQRESLLVKEDAAAVEGLDETPDFAEEVASREKTIFVANVSLDTDTLFYASKMRNFFYGVGKVVRVRLIADDRGEPLGCGFVEFSSANEAKKAVQRRNGIATFVNLAEIPRAYPFQPKYNLADLAEKLWYEDNLRREGFGLLQFESELKKQLPSFCGKKQQALFCGKKITFSDSD